MASFVIQWWSSSTSPKSSHRVLCKRCVGVGLPTWHQQPFLPLPFLFSGSVHKEKDSSTVVYSALDSSWQCFSPSINRCIQGYSRINPRIENLPCQWSMFMDSPELVIQNLISTRPVAKIYQGISPFLYLWWLDAGLGVGMPVVWLIFSFNYWFLHISWTL